MHNHYTLNNYYAFAIIANNALNIASVGYTTSAK